nr:polyadenylate-binding protein 6-like isoform X2 [Ziziphus jujuba var. spinosa]
MFSKFGRILSSKVAAENGKTKGFGSVQYDSEQSAVSARNALHGPLVKGKKIYVSKFVKKSARTVTPGEAMKASLQGQNKNLFIARAEQKEIANCHMEKLKAESLPLKNLTHPVHYSSFQSLGKPLRAAKMKTTLSKSHNSSAESKC